MRGPCGAGGDEQGVLQADAGGAEQQPERDGELHQVWLQGAATALRGLEISSNF